MNSKHAVVLTILVHATLMLAAYVGLVTFFDFPDILREPVDVYLDRFLEYEALVVFCYALFMWSQVAFVAVVLAIREHLNDAGSAWLRAGTFLGVIAGFAQAIGFSRWAFVVPQLAKSFDTTPEVTLVVIDMLHRFAGIAVGEHLFFCFEALWAGTLGIHLLQTSGDARISRSGACLLLVIAGLIGLYSLEQFGGVFSILGPVNIMAHAALLLWLVGFAIQQALDRRLRPFEVAGLVALWAVLVIPGFF